MGLIARLIYVVFSINVGGGTCKNSNSQVSKSLEGVS